MSKIALDALSAYSLTTGAALREDWLWLAITNDQQLLDDPEDDHSFLVFWDGSRWKIYDNQFSIRSQAAIVKPNAGVVSINYLGGVAFEDLLSGGYLEDKVGEASRKKVYGRTVLNQVRNVAGVAYAVGTHRAVYRRQDANRWQVMDDGIFDGEDFDCGFDSVHGFSEEEIYAVGEGGEIWQFDGSKWQKRETGTNIYLHGVVCTSAGIVCAVGAMGTVLLGRNEEWRRLEGVPTGLEFWSVEEFGGRIYVAASTSLLFELVEGELRLVNFGECAIPSTVHHLFTIEGSLYALGSKHLRRFDGTNWHDLLTLE